VVVAFFLILVVVVIVTPRCCRGNIFIAHRWCADFMLVHSDEVTDQSIVESKGALILWQRDRLSGES